MAIIGTGSYSPSAKWTLTRAYARAVAFPAELTLESSADGVFTFNDFMFYNDRIVCEIEPRFWAWTSNHYTLDFIVKQLYYFPLPSTTPLPANFSLRFLPETPSLPPAIFVRIAPFSNTPAYHDLPAATVPYWKPNA